MAITRLRNCGAELNDKWMEVDATEQYGGDGITIQTDYVYTGTYSFRVWNGSITNSRAIYNFGSTITQCRVGLWYRIQSLASTLNHMSIRTSSGTDIAQLQCSSSGSQIYVNGAVRDSTGGNYYQNWHHILIDLKIDSVNGWCYVYRDGLLDLSWDGNTGSTGVNRFVIGKWGNNYTHIANWDDIYIDNTTGEASPVAGPLLRFYYVLPNGNGNYAQWTGSDGDSTDNYQLVDERPPSSTDYVQGLTADQYDSYAMNTISLADGQLVKAVIPTVIAKRNGSVEQLAIGTRYSSTDLISSDKTPGGSYDLYDERQTTKPGGGDWEQTSIDGMELLLKSRGTY